MTAETTFAIILALACLIGGVAIGMMLQQAGLGIPSGVNSL